MIRLYHDGAWSLYCATHLKLFDFLYSCSFRICVYRVSHFQFDVWKCRFYKYIPFNLKRSSSQFSLQQSMCGWKATDLVQVLYCAHSAFVNLVLLNFVNPISKQPKAYMIIQILNVQHFSDEHDCGMFKNSETCDARLLFQHPYSIRVLNT